MVEYHLSIHVLAYSPHWRGVVEQSPVSLCGPGSVTSRYGEENGSSSCIFDRTVAEPAGRRRSHIAYKRIV